MTSDFLTDLDAAVDGRCACLCGAPITGRSPSAYYASEECADRWAESRGRRLRPGLTLAAALANASEVIDEFLRAIAERSTAAMQEIARLTDEAFAVRFPQAPADPRERALWLRRNRNTGPRTVARSPRRIDPTRGLSVVSAGQPKSRPGGRRDH